MYITDQKWKIKINIFNPNLGGGTVGVILPPPGWFSLNNSEKVKSWNPSILQHLDICAKCVIPNSPQSPDIGHDVIRVNCDVNIIFPIYGQFGEAGSQILEAWSVKRTFSLILLFYPTKTQNRTKKCLIQL